LDKYIAPQACNILLPKPGGSTGDWFFLKLKTSVEDTLGSFIIVEIYRRKKFETGKNSIPPNREDVLEQWSIAVAIRQEKIESFAVPMEIPADPDQETDSNEQSLLREKKLLEKLQMCQKMRIENPELSLRQLAQMTGTSIPSS
jgi:hypothetical protein